MSAPKYKFLLSNDEATLTWPLKNNFITIYKRDSDNFTTLNL